MKFKQIGRFLIRERETFLIQQHQSSSFSRNAHKPILMEQWRIYVCMWQKVKKMNEEN